MGFALPAAIGAKIARSGGGSVGDRGRWRLPDDGWRVVDHRAGRAEDLNIAIINNGFLGMVRQWQEFFYERNYAATPLLNPDFAKLGEAYGIRSMTVRERSQVVPSVRAAREHDGPVLINFCVEKRTRCIPWWRRGRRCTR
jgi:acetolactate synthase I/II/III large subunit